MLKQQVVPTSLGDLTVSALNLVELRQLDSIFSEKSDTPAGIASLLRFLPVIAASVRKVQQDQTAETLESGLSLEDFNALFAAVLEVSGLKKASAGEALAPALV